MKDKIVFRECGEYVTLYDPIAFMNSELISIGNHVIISEFAYLNGGKGLYIGNHVHIATHSSISGGGYCVMEDFTGISAGVRLVTGTALFNGEGLTSPTLPGKFQAVDRSYVIIKKHATLATGVIVHPGITIAEGTIVGSGSIVTKDTEPWSIYMGVPARKVKDRDKSKILEWEEKVYKDQQLTPSDFSEIIKKILNKNP